MACQRCCRDVDVPHKAVVNRDSLCSAFSDALRFVHLDMVNELPQQRGGQLVHLYSEDRQRHQHRLRCWI